jgi:hypothetical protein
MQTPLCPYCDKDCLSFWQKSCLGPMRAKPCISCKRKVGVPWLHSMAVMAIMNVMAFGLGMYLVTLVGHAAIEVVLAAFVGGVALGSLPGLWLYYKAVPLVRRTK